MGTISSELTKFKNEVGKSNIDSMNKVCEELSDKLKEINNICSSAKSSFSQHYQSEQKDLVLSSFDCMSKIYSEIESSISSTMRPMISKASLVIDEVDKLEEINKVIEEQKNIINNNKGDDDSSRNRRNSANSIVNQKNIEFNTVHTEALNNISRLKAMDTAIVIQEFSDTEKDSSNNDVIVQGGSFKEQCFVSSNGVKITYYLYVPKVKDSSTKLPILTYFHGIQDTVKRNENNNFKYGGGLAGLIETGQLNPKGLIIFPQAENGTIDHDFITKPYQEAVIELIKETAKKYNGDLNRTSIAGHSNGGAAAQHIVNNYPGFFAATALMGIASNAQQGIAQTNLYALVGNTDNTMDSPGKAITYAKSHNQLYKIYNMGHDIQTIAFKEPVHDENGNSVMLVDWLMSKSLA